MTSAGAGGAALAGGGDPGAGASGGALAVGAAGAGEAWDQAGRAAATAAPKASTARVPGGGRRTERRGAPIDSGYTLYNQHLSFGNENARARAGRGPRPVARAAGIIYPSGTMNPRAGVAVFLDHHEARVFHVAVGSVDESTVRAPKQHVHRHPKKGTDEHNHPDDLKHFFADLARALDGATEVLLLGPSTAKLEFLRYAHAHAHALADAIVGIETVDHPTDKQLLAHIKTYFGIATLRVS